MESQRFEIVAISVAISTLIFNRFRGDSAAILRSASAISNRCDFYSDLKSQSDCDFAIWTSKGPGIKRRMVNTPLLIEERVRSGPVLHDIRQCSCDARRCPPRLYERQLLNKLKTTPPPPIKTVQEGGFVCHFSRNLLLLRDFYAIQTPIVWHMLGASFCKYWGMGIVSIVCSFSCDTSGQRTKKGCPIFKIAARHPCNT